MSAIIVTDVTSAVTGGGTLNISNNRSEAERTSITPFRKVLKKTAEKAESNSESTKVEKKKTAKTKEKTDFDIPDTIETLDDIFKLASKKYDISYDFLVAVAKAESDFQYDCVSSAGARGIMQLMPDEIKDMHVKDAFNPYDNIMAAARLLKAHLKKFKGDYTLAAAAYNAGSGAVNKYGGVPPYKETQTYVKRIKQYMKEGVKVPDKKVNKIKVSEEDRKTTTSKTTSSDTETTKTQASTFDEGEKPTDTDLDSVRITVGSGSGAVTMTYGAYQKYKELGTLGVG
ncbi:MAG: lytic transglycosylase domain-containing protein [Eubacterium sp.]|nr:lytic transglycosylase domain-containing protein [Eubacterium sp.]